MSSATTTSASIDQQKARASVLTLLQRWRTHFPDAVTRDVSQLICMLPALVPTLGTINIDRTRSTTALCLQGTIPMYHKGNRYNIPVNIWVLDDYPYKPPMVYVVPTPDMEIAARHKHVDASGRCYFPYITEWHPQRSSLYEMVNELSAIFGHLPPVFQKASAGTTHNPPPQQQQPTPTPPQQQQQQQQQKHSQLPPPPRPEERKRALQAKIQGQMTGYVKEYAQRMEQEMEAQSKLTARSKILEEQEKKLNQDHQDFTNNIAETRESIAKLSSWIDEHKNKEVNVDEAIEPNDIYARQMLECISEDNALDDLFYTLDKTLENEVIDFATYLKYVRKYARIQFEKKALMRKVFFIQESNRRVVAK